MSYTVVSGDTLSGIASKLGVSLSDLEKANPMGNYNVIRPGQVLNVPGKAGTSSSSSKVDPNSDQYQNALDEYGAIASFAKNNSEVNTILQEAIANQWDAARFERALWGTKWYKSLSDAQQALQVKQATDPGEYSSELTQMARKVKTLAAAAGVNVDYNAIAHQALWGGWDDNTLTAYLAQHGKVSTDANGAAMGDIGQYENQIRNTYASYGIDMGKAWYENAARQVAAGTNSTGAIANQAIAQASKLWPQYAQDFVEGRTLSDIATPFIQQMGNTLEIDPSSITLKDPTIMAALHGDGKQPTALYTFNQMLKNDPRWGKTDNAKNAAYDTLAQIGKDWGFTG